MRPCGDFRAALESAAGELGRAGTWRELAQVAEVGFDVARRTAENMVRDGVFERAGTTNVPGVCRPMVLYAPAQPSARSRATLGGELASVVRCWADFK